MKKEGKSKHLPHAESLCRFSLLKSLPSAPPPPFFLSSLYGRKGRAFVCKRKISATENLGPSFANPSPHPAVGFFSCQAVCRMAGRMQFLFLFFLMAFFQTLSFFGEGGRCTYTKGVRGGGGQREAKEESFFSVPFLWTFPEFFPDTTFFRDNLLKIDSVCKTEREF